MLAGDEALENLRIQTANYAKSECADHVRVLERSEALAVRAFATLTRTYTVLKAWKRRIFPEVRSSRLKLLKARISGFQA